MPAGAAAPSTAVGTGKKPNIDVIWGDDVGFTNLNFGMMGCLMGAALVSVWRVSIFLSSGVGKAFMVWLVGFNAQHHFVGGFCPPPVPSIRSR